MFSVQFYEKSLLVRERNMKLQSVTQDFFDDITHHFSNPVEFPN